MRGRRSCAGGLGAEIERGGRQRHRGSDAFAFQPDHGTAVVVAEEGHVRGLGPGSLRAKRTWTVQLEEGTSGAVQFSESS